ncbi:hypothetical protein CsSME_00018553 [Camellia sinensis var. sinensis]
MLAIFHKAFAHPPEELNSPASKKQKQPVETLNDFLSAHSYPKNAFSMTFGDAAVLAYARPDTSFLHHQRVLMVELSCTGVLLLMALWLFLMIWRSSKLAVPNHLLPSQQDACSTVEED